MTDYVEKMKKATYSTMFLLPGIGTSRRSLKKYGFVNAYLDDRHHDIHYENAVYLLFRPRPMETIADYIVLERTNELLLEEYDYEEGYVVLVYRFNPKWQEDYHIFKEGKYSRMSREYKEMFPKFVDLVDPKNGKIEKELTLQYHIFNRTEGLKKMQERELGMKLDEFGDIEYWSSPDVENKETLDINKIKEEE